MNEHFEQLLVDSIDCYRQMLVYTRKARHENKPEEIQCNIAELERLHMMAIEVDSRISSAAGEIATTGPDHPLLKQRLELMEELREETVRLSATLQAHRSVIRDELQNLARGRQTVSAYKGETETSGRLIQKNC